MLLSHTSALRIAAAASTGATRLILEFVWSRDAFGDLAAARERNFSLPYQYALEPRGAAVVAVFISNRLPDFARDVLTSLPAAPQSVVVAGDNS